MSSDRSLVPVTVIGGYLGAGKTTLVNQLLRQADGRRLAVLVNDFGALNVDAALVEAHDGETLALTNGCICCSIADSLGESLDAVLALDPPPDHIVIEASGVADPQTVAGYGHGWPGCRLDAVVVLADAETVRTRADDRFVGELVTRQLRRGDVVLLTKPDLVDRNRLEATTRWLEQVAGVPVVAVTHGEIDIDVVISRDASPPERLADAAPAGSTFESATLTVSDSVDTDKLLTALENWPDRVLRVKGTVLVAPDASPHLVQRVGRRWSIEPVADLIGSTPALVVIFPAATVDPADLAADLR